MSGGDDDQCNLHFGWEAANPSIGIKVFVWIWSVSHLVRFPNTFYEVSWRIRLKYHQNRFKQIKLNICVLLLFPQVFVNLIQFFYYSTRKIPRKDKFHLFLCCLFICLSRILLWSPLKALKGMKDLINLYSTFLIDFASQPFRRVYFKNGQNSFQNMTMIWSTDAEKQSRKQIECDPCWTFFGWCLIPGGHLLLLDHN